MSPYCWGLGVLRVAFVAAERRLMFRQSSATPTADVRSPVVNATPATPTRRRRRKQPPRLPANPAGSSRAVELVRAYIRQQQRLAARGVAEAERARTTGRKRFF